MNKKIYFFIGTTAELIRIAPIIKQLRKRKMKYKIITSGQVKIWFKDIEPYTGQLRPDIAFKEKVNRSSLLHFSFWAVRTLFTALITLRKEFKGLNKQNSYFVICGDPVSTSIGALVAWIYGLKILHIESGDLSGNLLEPFPEEICRNINVRLADVLFPPGDWANNNLKNLNKPKINTYYNTFVECFMWFLKRKYKIPRELRDKKYYVLILHRQEHILFGRDWSQRTLKAVIENTDASLTCVLFKHPLTAQIIETLKLSSRTKKKRIMFLQAVPYPQFLTLMKKSEFIATDGATNQLEAYLMGKPCLILRNHTEQVEGLGKNVVLFKSSFRKLKYFLLNYKQYESKPIHLKIKPSDIVLRHMIGTGFK